MWITREIVLQNASGRPHHVAFWRFLTLFKMLPQKCYTLTLLRVPVRPRITGWTVVIISHHFRHLHKVLIITKILHSQLHLKHDSIRSSTMKSTSRCVRAHDPVVLYHGNAVMWISTVSSKCKHSMLFWCHMTRRSSTNITEFRLRMRETCLFDNISNVSSVILCERLCRTRSQNLHDRQDPLRFFACRSRRV